MKRLLACPFCREMHSPEEGPRCEECEVDLVPLEALPPSLEASDEQSAQWEQGQQEDDRLNLADRLAGVGALAGLSIAGLVIFAATPWVEFRAPFDEVRTGLDLARGRLGLLWAGAAAQFVTLPLLASRQSLRQMQGVRVICGLFASLPLVELLLLMARSPRNSGPVYFDYSWSWGAFLAMAVSAASLIAAARLGRRSPRLAEEEPPQAPPPLSEPAPRTLH